MSVVDDRVVTQVEKDRNRASGQMSEVVNLDELAIKICSRIENNVPKELRALAETAVNSRGMLDAAIDGIGHSMEEFERVTKGAETNVRLSRMCIVTEAANTVKAL